LAITGFLRRAVKVSQRQRSTRWSPWGSSVPLLLAHRVLDVASMSYERYVVPGPLMVSVR
jgi:hypothetical protein